MSSAPLPLEPGTSIDVTFDRWEQFEFAVIGGHFHRSEVHSVEGIDFHISGPVVGWWGRQTTFRHWTVRDGQLSFRTLYVTAPPA